MKNKNLSVAHKASGPVETKTDQPLYEILKSLPKPDAKFKLSASQKKWWYYFGYELVKTRQIVQLDLVHLQNAAVSMDARSRLVNIINQLNQDSENGVGGWVQEYSSGATALTAYQNMYDKATKQLNDVSAHFGLSLKDRSKLNKLEEDSGQLGLFDQVYKKLTAAQ